MTVFKKKYPKTIYAKKSIAVLASVFLSLIVVIILININKQSHEQHALAKRTIIKEKVNTYDVDWYKTQTVSPAIKVENNNKEGQGIDDVSKKEKQIYEDNTIDDSADNNSLKAQSDPEMEKILQAPISSNQITDNSVYSNVNNQTQSSAQSNSNLNSLRSLDQGIQNNQDQNLQSNKKAFLQTNQKADPDYLMQTLKNPISPYEVKAGTVIPATLITGINSDLPGQIIGQVRNNVYDTVSGKYLLIPQGSKLTGLYDSQVAYGQSRVLVVWQRIIFPNGQSINLEGMPGIDLSGYAGFNDQVNNHYMKIFGSVILMSAISAGAQLSQPSNDNNNNNNPTVNQMLAASLGTNIMNTSNTLLQKNLGIQPTLVIRPGYLMNVSVTKDIVFPNVYQ